jgi:hypothetical protein
MEERNEDKDIVLTITIPEFSLFTTVIASVAIGIMLVLFRFRKDLLFMSKRTSSH